MRTALMAADTRSCITPAIEDYLSAIYHLACEAPDVRVVSTQRIAGRLNLSSPSVTNMMKRLSELDLVTYTRYHGVMLTASGQSTAREVVRRRQVLEYYLVEALGFQWDEAHAEAEHLEHYISQSVEARIETLLGNPTIDPQGPSTTLRSGLSNSGKTAPSPA